MTNSVTMNSPNTHMHSIEVLEAQSLVYIKTADMGPNTIGDGSMQGAHI